MLIKIIISKRSMTYSGNDTSWTSSKLNGLIRSTTMSLGNKVKNVATNIAKDLNESMKESIAYYANEVRKFSIRLKAKKLYYVCFFRNKTNIIFSLKFVCYANELLKTFLRKNLYSSIWILVRKKFRTMEIIIIKLLLLYLIFIKF